MSQKIVLQHPTGNANVRAVVNGLSRTGMLAEFNTTVAVNPKARWLKFLPERISREWLRRAFPETSEPIWTHPFRESARMILPRLGFNRFVQHETGWASVDAVYRDMDRAAARRLSQLVDLHQIRAVYAYEDGALAMFTRAKELGLTCIYDLPIAFWETGRRLMMEEADRLPEWASTLGGGIRDSAAKLERKTRELELADVVIGPGTFVMDSLPGWARGKRQVMAPFGSPVVSRERNRKDQANRPLRVLFVGSMGQRKGLADLFKGMRLLNRSDVELVVMGSLQAPMDFYQRELPGFTYESGRPHEQVLQLMQSCDVLCLPSIVEGRALVMQEAMSQGLPLIITPNTGGADLIREGETGFLVPIRSPEAIAAKINWFLEHRSAIPIMGELAQEHAARYSWERYGTQIVESITEFMQ